MTAFGPLISPEDLAEMYVRKALFTIIDTRQGREAAASYRDSRLAGAFYADLNTDLSTPLARPADAHRGGRHPLPPLREFCAKLGRWGVDPEVPVVVYDAQGGGNAAARLWWMLRALGHIDVAVVDGGFEAALGAGVPLDFTSPPDLLDWPPYPAVMWGGHMESLEAVMDRSYSAVLGFTGLVDARHPARWAGRSEPIDPVPGRIPGARNLYHADTLGPDGRFRSPAELRELFLRVLGDHPVHDTVMYCGSGVTACQNLLAMEIAGLSGAGLYVGSYSEWCRQPHLPVAEGDEP